MNDIECDNVLDFNHKFGQLAPTKITHLTQRKLMERVRFHLEEAVTEFTAAAEKQDMVLMTDALVDAVYVIKGTAIMLGLTTAWNDLWDDVQRANMAKVRGATQRGNLCDVAKPPGWEPPQTAAILEHFGYRREEWLGPDGEVNEGICLDDLEHLEANQP